MLISSKTKMRTLIGFTSLIILIMCIYGISCIPASERKIREKREFSGCDFSEFEQRLAKLEREIRGKSEKYNLEMTRNTGKMNRLREANYDMQDVLENLQQEFSRISNGTVSSNSLGNQNRTQGLDGKLKNLSYNLQNALDALVWNNLEIKSLKKDVENMRNYTEKFLSNNASSVKHRTVRHITNKFPRFSHMEKPQDCIDLKQQGKPSGVYKIYPEEYPRGFLVLCEMDTRGGGWTVIQNRYDGTQNFYLNFQDYRVGFGNLAGEFWLGLENIYHLTGNEVNELLVELVDFTSTTKYAYYGSFSIGSEKEGFSLKLLGNYEGNAGDSLIYQTGSRFSTKDVDRDEWEEGNCAKSHGGAWWYKSCDTSNLNGKYLSGELPENQKYTGMYWGGFRGATYSLKQARMMVRPRDKQIGNERNMLIK